MIETAPSAASIDLIFVIATVLIVTLAYWRGLGREILQLGLFVITATISVFVFDDSIRITHPSDILPTLRFVGWFALAMYLITFLLSRWLTNRFLGKGKPTDASRWGGVAFALVKVFGMLLSLNFAYAVINPNADRLADMPEPVQNSVVLTTSDAVTEALYRQLARWHLVEYKKILYRQKTIEEQQQERLEEKLGVKLLKKPWE